MPGPERWTGPEEGEIDVVGTLLVDLPPERWPYGPPAFHETHCRLVEKDGAAGSFCDCDASAFNPCEGCLLYGCDTCASRAR